MQILSAIAIIIVLFIVARIVDAQTRKKNIYRKYGRNETAERIIKRIIWVGETQEQLVDSLGRPCDIDQNVLKTKMKETWKYFQKSPSRFGMKIKVEDGVVVGWDEKL